jgi:hypothetical protein
MGGYGYGANGKIHTVCSAFPNWVKRVTNDKTVTTLEARPIPQEAFDWYDEYAHGFIDRRTIKFFREHLAD